MVTRIAYLALGVLSTLACGSSRCGAACGPAVQVTFGAPVVASSYRVTLALDGRAASFECRDGAVVSSDAPVASCGPEGFSLDAEPSRVSVSVQASGMLPRAVAATLVWREPVAVCDFTCRSASLTVP